MNATGQYQFTIIVPLFNEKDNLEKLEKSLSAYLPRCSAQKAGVLFVDDGSTDEGTALLGEICSRNEDFHFIRFAENCGLSAALKAGFELCQSPLVGYMDADLQTDPEDFNILLERMEGNALVTGIRAKRNDSAVKKASSAFANSFRRMMTHDGAVDTGCPLKVMQTSYAKKLPLFKGMHRFIPALILMMGGTYEQIPVRHYPRTAGKSKYKLSNRLLGPLVDCFAYRWMKKRHSNFIIEQSDL